MQRRDRYGVLGVFTVFVACGIAQATWAVQLPSFRAVLALSDRDTGLLTGALSASCCVGLVSGTLALRRLQAQRLLAAAASAIIVGAALLHTTSVARSAAVLVAALAVLGLGIGTADVSANVLGGAVERRTGRVLLPVLHAGFSAGLVAGAVLEVLGGAGGTTGASVSLVLCVTAAAAGLLALRSSERCDPGRVVERGPARAPSSSRRGAVVPSWAVVVPLGSVLALAAAVEGIGDTWVPVLAAERGTGPSPALVYLGFTTAVLVGRLLVHRAGRRWNRVVLLRVALVVAAVGLALAVLDTATSVAVLPVAVSPVAVFPVAVFLWGAGTGVAFPLTVSEAAARGSASRTVVPAVTAAGYAGFLVGPAGVGLLAQSSGHGVIPSLGALLVVAALLVAVLVVRAGHSVAAPPAVRSVPRAQSPRRRPHASGPRTGSARSPAASASRGGRARALLSGAARPAPRRRGRSARR